MRTLKHALLPLLFCLPLTLPAQFGGPGRQETGPSNQPTLETRLIGKPLYLRGMWRADTLSFDGTGKLLSPSQTTSFTLAGVDITRVQLQGNALILDGRRIGLELEQRDAQARVPLLTDYSDPNSFEPIHIEIALAPGADYSPALSAIFAEGPGSLTASLPAYWQLYAKNNFLAPGNGAPLHGKKQEKAVDKPIYKGGKDSIIRPTLARSAAPETTKAAFNLRYKASVIVSVIVEKDGVPSHIQLLRPAGLGLDEQAVAAVQKYIFNPATQKGRPVPVDLNIVIDFNGGNSQQQSSTP